MTLLALALVLTAAVLHATWNYWAKRAGGGLPFVYLVGLIVCAGYVPIVAAYLHFQSVPLSLPLGIAVAVSGLLKTGYSLFLQRGYRTADFSLIYPLARGTGPLLSALGAIALLGERPSRLGACGAIAIVVAIFWVAGGHRWFGTRAPSEKDGSLELRREDESRTHAAQGAAPVSTRLRSRNKTRLGIVYGLTAGAFIASYTLWDKRAVSHWLIAPVLYDAGTAFTQLILLSPLAWKRRREVAREWREHRANAFIMAATAPLGYILILTAMRFTAVSYVAPAREVSILIGLFFGARFLNEKEARSRVWAALVMLAGLAALALG